MKIKILILTLLYFFIVCFGNHTGNSDRNLMPVNIESADTLIFPGEKHFKNMKMLTAEGNDNAEAYFSFDGTKLIFQSTRPPFQCDQIYSMNTDGSDVKLLSTGKGRTTCAYFYPDGKHIFYSSTHLGGDDCPPKPDYS